MSAHVPVMLSEVVSAMKPADGEVYVDGTFGAGGYSRAMLQAARCTVFAIDRDPDTKVFASALEREFPGRFVWLVGNFSDMCALLRMNGVAQVDGVVLDIGVSSMQLAQAGRGFSFSNDGPLDMRMGGHGISAAEVVNQADEATLADILYRYGEERASRRIAHAIVQARAETPITRTSQLAEIVRGAIGRSGKADPATRTFQALRVHVNDELGELTRGLQASEALLKQGGRLVVVTFHSLEDRIVKQFAYARSGKVAGVSRHLPALKLREAGVPTFSQPRKMNVSAAEAAGNPRSRSATLRAMVRTAAPAREDAA